MDGVITIRTVGHELALKAAAAAVAKGATVGCPVVVAVVGAVVRVDPFSLRDGRG